MYMHTFIWVTNCTIQGYSLKSTETFKKAAPFFLSIYLRNGIAPPSRGASLILFISSWQHLYRIIADSYLKNALVRFTLENIFVYKIFYRIL